jgi:hypothetical protein
MPYTVVSALASEHAQKTIEANTNASCGEMKDLINATSGTDALPNTGDDITPAIVERAAINGKRP